MGGLPTPATNPPAAAASGRPPWHRLPTLVFILPTLLATGGCARKVNLDEVAFRGRVRPLLQRLGCAAPSCHGSGLIGLKLAPGGQDFVRDLVEVRRHVAVGEPGRSALLDKALGRHHLGGRAIDPAGCDASALVAWIRGVAIPACPDPTRPVLGAGLPRALDATLRGCVVSACHGGAAAPRLVDPDRAGAARVNAQALAPAVDTLLPTRSRLLARLRGEAGHPRSAASPDEPIWRLWFAWISGDPVVAARTPSFAIFARDIQPLLGRRGCTHSGCHGNANNPPTLVNGDEAVVDNYLRLLARIGAGSFPAKPRNDVPHGGGRRLGGSEDCAMVIVQAWLEGRVAPPCTPRAPPDRARFASLVQPSLEALTCPRCHSDERLGFHFVAAPDAAGLARNYDEVLDQVDVDYPPVSPLLLRVHEECMQARMLAWVDSQPDPGCVVELRNFKGSFPPRPGTMSGPAAK